MREPHKHFAIRRTDGTFRNNQHGWNETLFKEDSGAVGTRFWKNLRAAFQYADTLHITYDVVDANEICQIKPDLTVAYGYCPHCQAEVVKREKCHNGDDTCANGHKYPMKNTLHNRDQPLHS